jgi:hypothetical protein
VLTSTLPPSARGCNRVPYAQLAIAFEAKALKRRARKEMEPAMMIILDKKQKVKLSCKYSKD